jgi:hypothetical protein
LRAVTLKPRRLGPRSLSPPLFLERCVGAYSRPGCCLPTSATAYDVRTKDPGLPFPRRDDGHDHLPFLERITHDLPLREAVTRGEPRIRPCDHDPGVGSSRLPRFARPRYLDHRDTFATDGLHRLQGSSVPIDVHGSLDRAKDVSSSVEALIRRHREECVRLAHADDVPLLILPEGTCCHRCGRVTGNEPQPSVTDRPRPKLLRHPAKAAGIPWTRVPSTVAAAGS